MSTSTKGTTQETTTPEMRRNTKPAHVVLIHQAFAGPEQPGGTRHYELGTHLVRNGHRFTVVASDLSYLSGQRVTKEQGIEEWVDGIRVFRAYTHHNLHKSFVWRVIAFFSFAAASIRPALSAGDVDVVYGTTPPIFQAVSAWIVSVLRRRPFLLEVRDLWPEFAIDMGILRNPVLIKLSRVLEKFLYRRATHLLVNSPAYRNYLIGKGVPPAKITLISNGVDPEMFDPGSPGKEVRQQFGLQDKFVVCYAGALGMANDINTVIEAAVQVRDRKEIHFLLVGDGKERPNLERRVGELKLENVTFTGTQPKQKMKEFLAAADACLAILQDIPMFRTTYPNKVFDYMAAGKPTVLAIDGVIREVIEAAGGGLYVPPGNAQALAHAICALNEDRSTAASMGRAAREYVSRHFNRSDQAEQLLDLVSKLANSRAR